LINGVVLAFFSGLFGAVFRSNGRYAFSNFSGHLLRFAEWLGGMLGLWLHADFIGVASGMLLTRILGSVALSVYAAYAVPDIQWRFKQVNWTDFKSMLSPSLYFMVFPLSSALSLQGFTLLVGALLGSADVAVFNTYRTIARLIVQVNSTLSFAVEPEMSRYFGASKMAELRNLFRKANLISSGMAVLASTLMFFVAQYFLEFWTHGRISYQPTLMMVMLAYATITGLWHIPKALLIAINQHRRMAIFSLLISGLSLLIAYSFAKYGYLLEPLLKEAGLSNEFLSRSYLLVEVTAILVFGEMAMAIIVHLQARKVLKHA
jgi:O-antigen/teichoic acid export membrane protein